MGKSGASMSEAPNSYPSMSSMSEDKRCTLSAQEIRRRLSTSTKDDDLNQEPNTNTGTLATVPNGLPSQQSRIPQGVLPNGKPMSPIPGRESTPIQTVVTPQTVSSKDPKAAAAAANDMRNVVRRKLTGYVGFANLPNQWHRKSVRKGFSFNVMVVGEIRIYNKKHKDED